MKKSGKEAKFLNALAAGRKISRAQAKSQFKLGNPSATVLRIQEAGFDLSREYAMIRRPKNKYAVRTVKYSIKQAA